MSQGDLPQAQRPARWVAEHETPAELPAGSERFVQAMRDYARQVDQASAIPVAASATARMGRTCGMCHAAYGAGPRFRDVSDVPGTSDVARTQMIRHRWAMDRLWKGLTGPSDEMWTAGAAALAEAPLYSNELAARARDPDAAQQIQQLADRVRELGARAADAGSPDQRAEVFGDLLSTCAFCHDLAERAMQ